MEENPLWQFSLSFYSKPGVEPLLLKLQDDFDADVNLLLCACWLGSQGYVLDAVQWSSLIEVSNPWRTECILPLRSVRRFLKSEPGVEKFRDQIKALELEGECYQQHLLYQQLLAMDCLGLEQRENAVLANLQVYSNFIVVIDEAVLTQLLNNLQQVAEVEQ